MKLYAGMFSSVCIFYLNIAGAHENQKRHYLSAGIDARYYKGEMEAYNNMEPEAKDVAVIP